MENDHLFGWLVIARHLKAKRDFPTYTVLCDSPGEAIETVYCHRVRESKK